MVIKFAENYREAMISSYSFMKSGLTRFWYLLQGHKLILDLAFDTRTLRNICEKEEEAIQKFGPNVAGALKHRLADLRAAISTNDIVAGSPYIVKEAQYSEYMVITLGQGYRMTFSANHPNNHITLDGNIDWLKVSRIKILQIGRDND